MVDVGFEPEAGAHRRRRRVRAGPVGRGAHVTIRGARGHAKGVTDRARDRGPRRTRTRPGRMASPAASALVHVSGLRRFVSSGHTAPDPAAQRPGTGSHLRAYRLVQQPRIAVDDQHVAVAATAATRDAAFDPPRLVARLRGNGVAGRRSGRASVTLVCVVEHDRFERLRPRDDHVRHAVDDRVRQDIAGVAAPVGVQPPRAAVVDPGDERRARRVNGCLADVYVPPVVAGQEGKRARKRASDGDTWRRTLRRGRRAP